MSLSKTVRLTVVAADGLIKKDLFFKLPDPFGTLLNAFYKIYSHAHTNLY